MKKTTQNLNILTAIFCVSLVVSNVVTSKVIPLGIFLFGSEVCIPGAVLCYAITYLMTDIIGEIWGKKQANKTVMCGFICQLLASILILLTQFLPCVDSEMQTSYSMVLGQSWIFFIGSTIAYFASQSWDVWMFHLIRDKYIKKHGTTDGGKWLWNNGSTMTSQMIDTIIFITISFGFGMGYIWNQPQVFVNMVIGQYVVKFLLAAIDTPFFYFFTRKQKG